MPEVGPAIGGEYWVQWGDGNRYLVRVVARDCTPAESPTDCREVAKLEAIRERQAAARRKALAAVAVAPIGLPRNQDKKAGPPYLGAIWVDCADCGDHWCAAVVYCSYVQKRFCHCCHDGLSCQMQHKGKLQEFHGL